MNSITPSKISKPVGDRRNSNRDKNLKSFEVIYGEVIDKSKRQAIASFSRAAHFNFTSPCKCSDVSNKSKLAKHQTSTNETFFTPKDNTINVSARK